MTKQILKTILAGILAGLALFIMPFFLLRILALFLIIGAVVRLLGGGRHRFRRRQFAFAERFNNMTDEEKAAFKEKMQGHCGPFSKTKEKE